MITVESLMSGQLRDSISTVAPHWPFELLNRIEWHDTVEFESRDWPDGRDSTVWSLLTCIKKRKAQPVTLRLANRATNKSNENAGFLK